MLTLPSIAMKPISTTERITVDTNIVLYARNDAEPAKKEVALNIIRQYPTLSTQCFTEVINVCRRKWKYDKNKQVSVADFLLNNSQLLPTDEKIIRLAHQLITRYDFQYFDSLIVAAAWYGHCTILYTEDMHHDLLVEDQVRIVNPFR